MVVPTQAPAYRCDIDGLRAIAILPVIAFHFGYLPNGFLGVDVFFVISGYLITGIIYNKLVVGQFSLATFYLRRIRRIIPLTLFVTLVSLSVGVLMMLPDDLENLAQSVIATNLFGNNILQAVTTKNYWDVVNEYKPLLHTWSLGVEEQYYLFYPLLVILVAKKRIDWLLPLLILLTVSSMILFFSSFEGYQKFYFIPFRFFELSIGGIAVIFLRGQLFCHQLSFMIVLALIMLLLFPITIISDELTLVAATVLTLGVLLSENSKVKISSSILENPLAVAIGKISFSLYMWHQLLIAFARYFWVQELHTRHVTFLFLLTVALSVLSYYVIEQPFRDKKRISANLLLLTVSFTFLATNAGAFYVYQRNGILKDVPELDLMQSRAGTYAHGAYNERIKFYDKNFVSENKTNVLIVGDSFARDWANVLLESRFSEELEISYISNPSIHASFSERAAQAEIVFWSTPTKNEVRELGVSEFKTWAVGTKSFGLNNGIFYTYSGDDYYLQRTQMQSGILEYNELLKFEWQGRYMDYIEKIVGENSKVPVFTPSGKFISQDCRHLVKAGAQYFAELFDDDLKQIFGKPMTAPHN